jgi:hypothetical protein
MTSGGARITSLDGIDPRGERVCLTVHRRGAVEVMRGGRRTQKCDRQPRKGSAAADEG